MNVLSLLCGCMIPIIFAAIVFISEAAKVFISWDFRYFGMSWFTIWRAERAYKRGDMHTYRVLVYGKEATAHQEQLDRKKYGSP